ncbi:hypothetical protein BH11PSE10_BH11PSE10_14180 [soil metagenome]
MTNPLLPTRPEVHLSRRQWLTLAGAVSLTACGGGSPSAEDTSMAKPLGVATGGTGHRPTAFLSAAITMTTPLGVGGISLDTRGAVLVDGNDQPLREAELALGMTARVLTGAIVASSAKAFAVRVDTQVAGPASWLDSNTLVVLGQRVSINAATQRGPGANGTPAAVQVWGELDLAAGRILATRLERAQARDALMLRGVLTAIDHSQGSAQVGTLIARTANPALLPTDLAPGAVVRLVLGEALPDGSWQLLKLQDDALRPPDGLRAELEGRVTQFTAFQHFQLDGVPVDASNARFENQAQLQAGAEVQVAGAMQGGVLMAESVTAEAAEPLELSGRVQAINRAAQTFELAGWTVHWSSRTAFGRGLPDSLRVGRKLAVLGRWAPGATALEALRIMPD